MVRMGVWTSNSPYPPCESPLPHLGYASARLFNLKCYCGPQNNHNNNHSIFFFRSNTESFWLKVSASPIVKQSTLSHEQPSVCNCPGLQAWLWVSPWLSQPPSWFVLAPARCRLTQRRGCMFRWPKCQVGYTGGEGRGKTHPEHIRIKLVRPGMDLSAVPGTSGHLPYPQHCWTLSDLHWTQPLFQIFVCPPTSRNQEQFFYRQDNPFSNTW